MTLPKSFLDARSIPAEQVLETDVCIVGAGAAGIALAREFNGQPFRVLLLESGGLKFDAETQSLYEGDVVGLPYHSLDTARLRYFGGTTNHWAGWARPLSPIDFRKREWVPHSGWPFDRTHLDPYYKRAQSVCRLGPYWYDASDWAEKDKRRPLELPDGWVHPIFQMVQKMSFGVEYGNELATAPNLQTLLYANAVEFETDETARTVQRVRVATLGGNRFWVSARVFILATGGIENARLLLVSNRVRSQGLGNEYDLVGRFFADHAIHTVGVFLPASPYLDISHYGGRVIDRTLIFGALAHSEETLQQKRLLNSCLLLGGINFYSEAKIGEGVASFREVFNAFRRGRRPQNLGRHLANILWDIDLVTKVYGQRAIKGRRLSSVQVMIDAETVPNPDSRVLLSSERDRLGMNRVQLDWRLAPLVKDCMQRSVEMFAESVGAKGLGRVQLLLDDEQAWPLPKGLAPWTGPRGGFHHMGTTRMNEDPKQGVVDASCRVHGMSNLYIAGSSVFPTYGYANPTFTIVTLALRLADHLKSVLRE